MGAATSVDDLPADYKEIYSGYRDKKNQRFAGFLNKLGMSKTAQQLLNDKSIREEADFNAVKTWTEYINRLVGAIVGLLVVAVFVGSLRFIKMNSRVALAAGLALLTVVVTGWFGSLVVSTNLTPWTVTLHMALALVTVALLVSARFLSQAAEKRESNLFYWLSVALILTVVQVFLGTRVREAVDKTSLLVPDRSTWIEYLGSGYLIHRSFSWLLLLANVFIMRKLFKEGGHREAIYLLLVTAGALLTGAGMAWFSIPPFLQPLHLLFGTLLFGLQFGLWLNYKPFAVSSVHYKTV